MERRTTRGDKEQEQRRKTLWVLPRDTGQALSQIGPSQCSNIGLFLDKFIKANLETGDNKISLGKIEPLQPSAEYRKVVAAYISRWQEALGQLDIPPFHVSKFEAKPICRFVVGLGSSHVQEVSITLHQTFGLPVIPGSALKGLTRAYAQLVLGKEETDAKFLSIFGSQESRGKVVFYDAVPLSDQVVPQLDVMTPHYSEYYTGTKPPADYLKPVPVQFYVVENTRFLFALGSTDEGCLRTAVSWLKEALSKMGVGAKTTSGYGYFQPL